MILTSVSVVLQKVGPTLHCSRLVYLQSYMKQELRDTGLDQCINSPTKSRTYDLLVSSSVLIVLVLSSVSTVLQKVGLTIHWSRLVYRQSYKKKDLRYTGLDQCINSPTKKQDLRYTGLDQCIDSPTKSRTYDTLFQTKVSIVLHNVGLGIHWS